MSKLSNRVISLPVSATRKLTPYAQKAKAEGVKVFHLNIGDPDLKTPENLLEVLKNWTINPIRYSNSQGEADFLEALTWYYHSLGFNFINSQNLQITEGASEAVNMMLYTLFDPGDQLLVFEPFYSNYATSAHLYGVELIPVPTTIENGFHLPNEAEIRSKITPKTKAIFYCSPANPTGVIYTKSEIETLVKIAQENELYLIADEVYREFNFTTEPHTSLLSYMQKSPEHLIIIDSLSKRYSLCGARLGNIVSLNRDFMAKVLKIAQNRLSAGLIDQTIGTALTKVPKSYTDQLQKVYKARRDLVYQLLSKIPGVQVSLPEGAFYFMVSLPVKNAEEFCIWLLEKFRDKNETVMFAAGSGFYQTEGSGIQEIRLAYVLSESELRRSIELLKFALAEYP